MRLTIFLLTAAFLHVSAGVLAQPKLSLTVKNETLEKVFAMIEKQTSYTFFYDFEIFKDAKNVTFDIKNATLEEVLTICLKDQPLDFKIVNTTISIVKKKEPQPGLILSNNLLLIDIHGRVTDSLGGPLTGASVIVKGSHIGTSTDGNGDFKLLGVNDNTVLVISFTGYTSRQYRVKGSDAGTILLNKSISPLDEVQIIAYGTTTRRLSTGNISSVTAAVIERQPVQNPLLALQGRIPGLVVIQTSGISGSSVKVRIQGQNSILNGNDPLYIIDGVPVISQLPRTGIDGILGPSGPNYSGEGNPLNYMNISDIESIDILKDADATAIYGSRGANGVILITTKKGKAGPMHLDLNMQTGWGQMPRRLNMLNTRQYLDMRYEAFRNDGINWTSPSVSANDLKVWDTTRYTDWQKELIGGTANYTSVNASVSGGTNAVRYLVSATYHKETTVFLLPKDFADQKGSVHFNLNTGSANEKFRMQFSGDFMFDQNQLPKIDLTQAALLQEPDAPALYNADGSINWVPDASGTSTYPNNPMIGMYAKYQNKTTNLISNMIASYKILPGLEISSSVGYNNMQTNDYSPSPLIAVRPEYRSKTQRVAGYGDRNIISWIIEPQLSYARKIGEGKVEILIGSTLLDMKTNSGYLFGTGYLSDEMMEDIHAASTVGSGVSFRGEYTYDAIFSRVNYNWMDKYIINLTARRDGSSRFGPANQFHNFGAVGVAWLFSSENFIKEKFDVLSFGKLKGSYGTTGSDQIGDYQFMSLYSLYPTGVPYQGTNSLIPAGLPNPYLQWEETKKLQVGIDLGFLQNRILVNVTFVKNRSSNQLLPYQLPTVAGFSTYLSNFPATIQNKNWEFSFNSTNIKERNFTWTSSFNLTIPQNKLVAFPNLSTSSYANKLIISQPISIERALNFVGVDPTTGNYMFGSKIDPFNPTYPGDYTRLINLDPKFYGGLQNNITYKGFELDFLFQFVKQIGYNDALFWNGNRYPGNFYRGLSNQPVTVLDRWQKPGDNASIKRFSTSPDPYVLESDLRYSDASYIRLKNASISWELPSKWISKAQFRNCRVYVQGQNLLTITNYKGLDPETQTILTSNSSSLPPLCVWTVGIHVGL